MVIKRLKYFATSKGVSKYLRDVKDNLIRETKLMGPKAAKKCLKMDRENDRIVKSFEEKGRAMLRKFKLRYKKKRSIKASLFFYSVFSLILTSFKSPFNLSIHRLTQSNSICASLNAMNNTNDFLKLASNRC